MSDLTGFDGWEVWECPSCGTQIGAGSNGRFTSPPKCCSREMEQKFAEAMPLELRDAAEGLGG